MKLIDRDALIAHLVDIAHKINNSEAEYYAQYFGLSVLEEVEKLIEKEPIIEDVTIAYWRKFHIGKGYIYRCSNCYASMKSTSKQQDYCTNCGAKMCGRPLNVDTNK